MIIKRLKYNNENYGIFLNNLQKEVKRQIEFKIQKGIYKFEEIDCIICKSSDSEVVSEVDRYGLYYRTNICKSCGLVYTSPRMTQASYVEFYNKEYRKLYVGKEFPPDSFFNGQYIKGERIYHFLQENNLIKNNMKILEVGCGAGGILQYFKEKGHNVCGIDIGAEYIDFGIKKFGLELKSCELSSLKLNYKLDLIIYSHVLEHIVNPLLELENIKNISTDETLLYIEVPGIKEIHLNYNSNIHQYLQNAHTFNFTLETLNNLMSVSGYKIICGNQFVQSVFKISNNNQYLINNDYYQIKKYLLKIERKYLLKKYSIKKIIVYLLELTKTKNIIKKLIK